MRRQDAYRGLDDVRDEYEAAGFAIRISIEVQRNQPEAFQQSGRPTRVTISQLETCANNLEVTYTIRLFAEFEGILRDYWLKGRGRKSKPIMEKLLDNIAAYRTMKEDDFYYANEVRKYRNELIHEHKKDPKYDFLTCLSRLAKFVSWLPLHW